MAGTGASRQVLRHDASQDQVACREMAEASELDLEVGGEVRIYVALQDVHRRVEADHSGDARMGLVIMNEGVDANESESLVAGMTGALVGIDQMEVELVRLCVTEVEDDVAKGADLAFTGRDEHEGVGAGAAYHRGTDRADGLPAGTVV